MKVLCFGSMNIDYTYRVKHFVRKGETLSADSLHIFSGGKGMNQAIALSRALSRMGIDTYHAGSIGEDGIFLLRQLEEAGVNTKYIKVLKQVRTGNAIIQNDLEGDNCILLYEGANRTITKGQVDEVLSSFQNGDYLVLQNEINEIPYIIKQAHEKGMKIVLNPSPMDDTVLRFPLEYVDYFILNSIEAAQILGINKLELMEKTKLANVLHEKFPSSVIVLTLGEKGSVYISSKEVFHQSVYSVKVVDTTAAGDTFTGFFMGGIIRGLSVCETMKLASKAAAIAVTRQGASPSIPTLTEVEQYLPL